MQNQLIEHLEKYETISNNQSGLRSKNSVNTCLAHLSNQILKAFKAKKSSAMILTDLQKSLTPLTTELFCERY